MCGIFGYVGEHIPDERDMETALSALSHRGPDQYGIYSDYRSKQKLWLGHRRLSILDLSLSGKQPFVSPDRKVAVAINGEIYNYQILRNDLIKKGIQFRSNTDSEVILWGYYVDGVNFFKKLDGMFAAAIWDHQGDQPKLVLLRDRMGIKPMHYWRQGNDIYFSSEIKAIAGCSNFNHSVNNNALEHYLALRFIPSPLTIYDGLEKVAPGEYTVFESGTLHHEFYWRVEVPKQKFSGTLDDAVDELDLLLNDAVQQQLMADVPIGAFLSGGIDSSLICAIMKKQLRGKKLKTFTIGFESKNEDESRYAKQIADYLGTEHTCKIMKQEELLDIIKLLPDLYDEPFADDSALSTYLLSKVAKDQVTIALSGDGGDELFFGYDNLKNYWKIGIAEDILPMKLRHILGMILKTCFGKSYLGRCGSSLLYDKFEEVYSMHDFFRKLKQYSFSYEGSNISKALKTLRMTVPSKYITPYIDMLMYLPDDICCKVDRASMAVSLEVRPPLLDHRIVEFANTLPFHFKYTPKKGGKIILKKLLERYLPKQLWNRPKQGFTPPVASWLRNELRNSMEALLLSDSFSTRWNFNSIYIRNLMEEHLAGIRNNRTMLWCLYCLAIWDKKDSLNLRKIAEECR